MDDQHSDTAGHSMPIPAFPLSLSDEVSALEPELQSETTETLEEEEEENSLRPFGMDSDSFKSSAGTELDFDEGTELPALKPEIPETPTNMPPGSVQAGTLTWESAPSPPAQVPPSTRTEQAPAAPTIPRRRLHHAQTNTEFRTTINTRPVQPTIRHRLAMTWESPLLGIITLQPSDWHHPSRYESDVTVGFSDSDSDGEELESASARVLALQLISRHHS